ncbi:MAG TPA: hypothetical protein VM686_09005 [Polyangiaceae bacterium]|nr:hypothetical protein [Polyangiaceae bacterium]
MRGWRGVAVIVGCTALGGCYRSATLAPANVQSIAPDGDALVVQRKGAPPLIFEKYDTVEIENFEDGTGYEFENPVALQREPDALVVSDRYSQRRFRRDEVEAIHVTEAAPERPWIIAGIATGSMLLLGFLGGNVAGCGQSHYSCGSQQLTGAFFGGVIGISVGLAIGIPSTSKLSPLPSAAPKR